MSIEKPLVKYVLFTMANHANKEGKCYCSYNTFAKYTGLSRQFVINAIKELEENGYILKRKRLHSNKRSTSNEYLILPDVIHKVIPKFNASGTRGVLRVVRAAH